RAVLAGPVLGWSLADIDRLDDARWSTVIDQLLDWAASWRSHGVAVAFRRALAANDAFARLAAQPGGDRVLTNLGHVVELLHREASRRHLGPAALLQWLRRQRDRVDDRTDDSELRLDRDDDAVQVLTVHRAKGLQFPVVFSPFLWTGAVRRTADAVVRVRDDIEGGMIVDIGFDDAVAPRDRHVVLARRQQWQEDIRLAYVALTRARHRNVVHFGSIAGASGTGLHRLLLASRPNGDVTSFEPDATTMSDDELRDQLDRFTGAAITVTDAPADVRGVPWQDEHRDRPHVHLRTVQRPLDRQWQRTSFTRLVHTPVAGADEHAGDFDETAQTEVQDTDVHGPVDEVPLARFPRGPAVGTAVHRMLEHLDFADGGRDHLVAHVDRFAREFTGDERRQLVDGVARALVTPLGGTLGDIALAAIARSDRRDELSFDLPVAGGVRGGPAVSLHALADVFAAHDGATDAPLGPLADRLRRRPDHRFRGMLTGSIDLVARVGDRYFLADYKTNWLGSRDAAGVEQSTVADYHLDRIRDVMVTHDYVLQYHLYLVALHRYLRLRLADYDYDTHIAGAAYLFLRGMLGTAQPA
ncbi:MAG: 3'-5' exonuclease, partial [Nitriliruptoraceae bacterium]